MNRPEYGVIYVAQKYPPWQHATLEKLAELYNAKDNTLPANKDILSELKKSEQIKHHMKKLMPFVQYIKVNKSPFPLLS